MVRIYRVPCLVALLTLGMLLQAPCRGEEPLPERGDTAVDAMQQIVSTGVGVTAAWIDSFFGHDNFESEANTTRLSLGVSSFTEQGEGTDFRVRNSLRLNLPYLEDRVRLTLSQSSPDFDTTDTDWEDIEEDVRGTNDTSVGAALTFYFHRSERRNLSVSAGVRTRDGSAAFYLQPRYRHTWRLGSWDLRFVQRVFWYADTRLDARSELQLERLLGSQWLFRTTALVDWYEDENGVFPQLNFSWQRRLSERRALAISWNSFFETYPNTVLESSRMRLRYRQQVWRRWLWFSVAPQVVFPRDSDYDPVPAIMFEVEARFQQRP